MTRTASITVLSQAPAFAHRHIAAYIAETIVHHDQFNVADAYNPSVTDPSQLGTLIFDLGPNSILPDDSQTHGSGNGVDLVFLLPNDYFTSPPRYIFLYSEFSSQHGGFEEWASSPCVSTEEVRCVPLITRQDTVPEPATLLLSSLGLGALAWSRRRKH